MTKKELIAKSYNKPVLDELDFDYLDEDNIIDGDVRLNRTSFDEYFPPNTRASIKECLQRKDGIDIQTYDFKLHKVRMFGLTCFDDGIYRKFYILKRYYNKYLFYNEYHVILKQYGIKNPSKIYSIVDEYDMAIFCKKINEEPVFTLSATKSKFTYSSKTKNITIQTLKFEGVYVIYNLIISPPV